MKYYDEFNDKLDKKNTIMYKRKLYHKTIFTFDIETTTVFIENGKSLCFDKNKNNEYYSQIEKIGFMYIWQFSVNDVVYYGRTWGELILFLQRLCLAYPYNKIVYVHNLAFEFHFLLNCMTFDDVFARDIRKTIKCGNNEYNIEFRCSYFLTNKNLEMSANEYNVPIKKLVGELDYNKIRTPITPLTENELLYCEYDCLALYHIIKYFVNIYGNVCNIPLTQTGRVRREMKNIYKNEQGYKNKIKKIVPANPDDYKRVYSAYSGGYTHSNRHNTDIKLFNVSSYDINSSYPATMVLEKFPMSQFIKYSGNNYNNDEWAYIFDVTFYDLNCKTENTYLSKSRCTEIIDDIIDNGRVMYCKKCRTVLTELDFKIINKTYSYSNIEYNNVHIAYKSYLNKKFVEYILTLFNEKTKLKYQDEKKVVYNETKQMINSLYGMCVTQDIRDDILFINNQWNKHVLTYDEINDKLFKKNNGYNTILSPAWGVWVSAYARYNLWNIITQIDSDVVYCDTDSVKFINNHDDVFNAYNKNVLEKIKKSAEYFNFSVNDYMPMDIKNEKQIIGAFDFECIYDEFKTLGAKRYAYIIDNKIGITISGVSKKTGKNALKNIDNFTDDLFFDYDTAGKKIVQYNDNQKQHEITDYLGNKYIVNDKYGIVVYPTTYTLNMSSQYLAILKNHGGLNFLNE